MSWSRYGRFWRPSHVEPVRTNRWVRPTALDRAMSAGTFPCSASSGFQIHMPLPWGMTGGGAGGGGVARVVVVLVGEVVVVARLTRTFFLGAGGVGSGSGVTTFAGIGCGAGTRASGGTAAGGAAGADPPWAAAAAVARMVSTSAAASPATK